MLAGSEKDWRTDLAKASVLHNFRDGLIAVLAGNAIYDLNNAAPAGTLAARTLQTRSWPSCRFCDLFRGVRDGATVHAVAIACLLNARSLAYTPRGPARTRRQKSSLLDWRAAALMCACAFNCANGRPPVS